MKTWDTVIVGGGVIGLSLAWSLRRHGLSVLIVERGEPAREASYAAGGMVAHCDPHNRPELAAMVAAGARMYPEFVHELMDESGISPDLRQQGTIAFFDEAEFPACPNVQPLDDEDLSQMEPLLALRGRSYWLPEASVDPRGLGSALVKAAQHRGVDFVTGSAVTDVMVDEGRAAGVRTSKSCYPAKIVVNCAGAWASQVQPLGIPTRPVKGQIVCVVSQPDSHHAGASITHVVRTNSVYLIPRSDGRILLGATVEEAGYDKRVDGDMVKCLYRAAGEVAPKIGEMRILEAWAGLRPGSPDDLPILGETALPGYFAATGHYRDGIMLAPVTAHAMTQLLLDRPGDFDLTPFSPLRFRFH